MSRLLISLFLFSSIAAHAATVEMARAGETLAGVVEYTGGFSKLDLAITHKDIVRSFRVAIPKFCKDVEIVQAGTVTEGVYDEAALVSAKEHTYSVNQGSGARIGGVRLALNGPSSPSCSIPVFLSSKKAPIVNDPGEEPELGTPIQANFCNRSGKTASIALGYHSGTRWMAKGWWKLAPGDCSWFTVYGHTGYSLYFYGKSSTGSVWGKNDAKFCVSDTKFVVGDAACNKGEGWWAPMTKLNRAWDGRYYLDLI
jgi:hypothetical protein